MNAKHWLAILGTLGLAVIAADYTVPKQWTRTGAEYVKAATTLFDPLNTDVPVAVNAKILTLDGDRVDRWTAEKISWLPDTITVGENTVTNIFKARMTAVFTRADIVRAYSWALVDGREASMVPIPPPPPPPPEPEP